MPQSEHDNRTISSVKSGHLRSVICGQPTSVLTAWNRTKSKVRATVEHVFLVMKRIFGWSVTVA